MTKTNALPKVSICPFCQSKKPKIHCRAMAFGKDAPKQRYLAQVICGTCFARGPVVPFLADITTAYIAGAVPDADPDISGTPANKAASSAIRQWNAITVTPSAGTEGT